jgi:hypothetical protein
MSNNSSIVAFAFFVAVKFLPSRYLATIGHTDRWKEFMKYAVEMDSGAIVYMQSFIKIGSDIQRLMEGGGFTHRQLGDLISLLLFLKNKARPPEIYVNHDEDPVIIWKQFERNSEQDEYLMK